MTPRWGWQNTGDFRVHHKYHYCLRHREHHKYYYCMHTHTPAPQVPLLYAHMFHNQCTTRTICTSCSRTSRTPDTMDIITKGALQASSQRVRACRHHRGSACTFSTGLSANSKDVCDRRQTTHRACVMGDYVVSIGGSASDVEARHGRGLEQGAGGIKSGWRGIHEAWQETIGGLEHSAWEVHFRGHRRGALCIDWANAEPLALLWA